MKTKLKTITACIALGAMMLNTNFAFGQCLDGQTCGAAAGVDKSYCYCCGSAPVIGAADCSSGTNNCNASFSWLPTAGLSNPNICNPTATPTVTTNYTLTVTYTCNQDCCCKDCCTATCAGAGCGGTCVRKDVVKVTALTSCCCRLANPDKQPEVVNMQTKLYPNPNPGIFTLEVEEIKPNMAIHVYNMQGEGVWAEGNVSEKQTIDISSLSKGLYFVEVKSGEQVTFYKKVVVK